MLSATAKTNLLQKHLKVLLNQWHQASDIEVKNAIELAFVLMLNKALGQILEEEKSYVDASNGEAVTDFTTYAQSWLANGELTPLQTELSHALQDANHWVCSWYKSLVCLAYSSPESKSESANMIAKESHGQPLCDLDDWFAQFSGLVENVRTQNEYC